MIGVTVRQLEVFREVVDAGSFSAAAVALTVTQPSISAHIRALEARVGEKLLDRQRGSRPQLTDTGQKIYAYAEEVLDRTQQISNEVSKLKSANAKTLSVSAQRYFVDTLLVKMIADFAGAQKDIEILANVGVMEDVLVQLREGIVDLGLFVSRGPIDGIPSKILGRHRLLFVAAAEHPLSDRQRISPDELKHHPFIGPLKGSSYGEIMDSAFEEIGLDDISVSSRSQNPAIMKELVKSGDAIMCCLEGVAAPELKTGQLIELPIDCRQLHMEMRLAQSPVRDISQTSKKFAEYLTNLKEAGFFKSSKPSQDLWQTSLNSVLS